MCWNIRGLGQDNKAAAIRNAIWKNKITLCSILEWKKEKVDDTLIRSLWGNVRCNYLYQPSHGAYGGIIIMWKEGVLHMEDHLMGAFSLSIKFRNAAGNFTWIFTAVYGASDAGDYTQCWQELSDIRILFEDPWLLGGDFNAILAQPERNLPGGNIRNRRSFINRHELIDLPMAGGKFTWTNSQCPPLLVRLDRFLMTEDWKIKCPSILQVRLKRPVSDHTTVMLNFNSGLHYKAPFRLDNYLLMHPDILPNLELWWRNLEFNGRPSYVFAKKLQGLKFLIKTWKRSLGDLQTQLEQLEEMIDSWDMQEENNTVLSTSEVVAREDAKTKHASVSLNLARKWGQRAKENWAKEAERNSRYLHQMASYKYICSSFNCLAIDGDISYDKSKMAEEAVSFYTSLFSEEHVARPGFENLELPAISVSDSISLKKPFTEDEVKNVIWKFGANKAPAPDGFTTEFYKAAWEIIKEDLMKVIKEFESNASLDWRINYTSLKLIPKVSGVVSLHNFRPISLISGVCKIISKLLADRLKSVLPSIIDNYQGAFIHDRQINDGILIAAEFIDSRIRANKAGIVGKVDFEKAFDNINWNCLDMVLERFGFGSVWRRWINWCISSVRLSILIGEATKMFRSQKGVRKGNPISPFLFIMVVELLSHMIKKVEAMGLISGFQVI